MVGAHSTNTDHVAAPKSSGEPGDLSISTLFGGGERSIWHALGKVVIWAKRVGAALRSTMRETTAIRERLVSIGFADMHFIHNAVQTTGIGATFVKVAGTYETEIEHGGVSMVNDALVIRDPAHYSVSFNVTGEGVNNTGYHFAIFKNGVETHGAAHLTHPSAAVSQHTSGGLLVHGRRGDTFDLRVKQMSGSGTTFTAELACLCVLHLADYGDSYNH